MDFRLGKLLVLALIAGALSTFAGSFAGASTGTATAPLYDTSRAVRLSQEEHHEVDKETEELHHDAADLPDAVDQTHKEHRLTESEQEHHRLRHEVHREERHLEKMSSDAKGTASGAESEQKEHETSDKVEHDQ